MSFKNAHDRWSFASAQDETKPIENIIAHSFKEQTKEPRMPQGYPDSNAQGIGGELEMVLKRRTKAQEAKSVVCSKINDTIDETTNFAHVLQEATQVFAISLEQRADQQV